MTSLHSDFKTGVYRRCFKTGIYRSCFEIAMPHRRSETTALSTCLDQTGVYRRQKSKQVYYEVVLVETGIERGRGVFKTLLFGVILCT